MKKTNEELVEKDEYYVERQHSRFNLQNDIQLYAIVGIAGTTISLIVVGGLVWIAHLFPVIQYTFIGAIAVLPLIGVGFLATALYKYIRKVQIISIAEKGNIVRLPGGNVQVFSTEEVYAYETKDAGPKPILLPQSVNSDLYYKDTDNKMLSMPFVNEKVFPVPFTNEEDIPTVYTSETVPETVAETVLETLRQEQEIARVELANKEREIVKKRIYDLHNLNLSLRSIAAIVHMQGRKYGQFKELCQEIGINTE